MRDELPHSLANGAHSAPYAYLGTIPYLWFPRSCVVTWNWIVIFFHPLKCCIAESVNYFLDNMKDVRICYINFTRVLSLFTNHYSQHEGILFINYENI